jgi:drug/metabolite transporter (DMT)-like permease
VNVAALVFVLISALLHALWNLLLKRAKDRVSFVWWFLLIPFLLFLPLAVWVLRDTTSGLPPRALAIGLVSGVVQGVALLAMTWAYRSGDLSVVYPLSRGSAQVLIVLLGVILLREHVTTLGVCGLGLVFVGVYVVFLRSFSQDALTRPFRLIAGRSSLASLFAGVMIATYHLLDRVGVQDANKHYYILLLFAADLTIFTGFVALRGRWDLLWVEWRTNRVAIALAGSLSLLSYLLVLFALSLERVSYVGPARNMSIVFGVLLGAFFLRERHGRMRLLGSILILSGILITALLGGTANTP